MRNHGREPRSQDFTDIHHLWWPRSLYKGNLEARFRNLACNKVRISRHEHNDIHHLPPPPKPSKYFMNEVLDAHKRRECTVCYPIYLVEGGEPL